MATGSAKKDAPTVEDLAAQLDTLRGDLARLSALAADFGRDRIGHASDRAHQHAANLGATAEREARHLRARASDFAHDVEGFMHERPATTIGLAVAFGFLVGMVSSRR